MQTNPSSLPIIAFGDALIDLLQTNGEDGELIMKPFPGGAPANVAAGVAKLGGVSHFAGGVGEDSFGDLLVHALDTQGVNTSMMLRSTAGPTGLAVVTVDEATGERQFAFYRHNAAYSHFDTSHFDASTLSQAGFFHFVSNIIAEPINRDASQYAIDQVKSANGLISFDVNYRSGFWDSEETAKSHITDFLAAADIIKLSEEELAWLEPNAAKHANYLESLITSPTKLVVLTLGEHGARYFSANAQGRVKGFATKAVDATAAGDSFVAGLLQILAESQVTRDNFAEYIQSEQIKTAIRFGCACGSIAVSSYGAIPSLPTREAADQLMQN